MSSVKIDFKRELQVQPERHRKSSLAMHPYFGKVDPALASTLIKLLSRPGETVLDPFCGSGTVLHEALLSGRNAIGWDSSPLAAMIAAGKLIGLSKDVQREVNRLADEIDQFSNNQPLFRKHFSCDYEVPKMPRIQSVSSWFGENALAELAFLRHRLKGWRKVVDPISFLLVKIAYSRIIVPASNQQGESTYRRIVKNDSPGRVIDLFVKSVREVVRLATSFDDYRAGEFLVGDVTLSIFDDHNYSLKWGESYCKILTHDSREFIVSTPSEYRADLVVSSPPYLMSWDYGLYHKFRFYWLDFDLDCYEATEIGRHLRRKKDDVDRYCEDMTKAFNSISAYLNPGACIALINAPSVVYGSLVDTNKLLEDCGRRSGWNLQDCVSTIDIPGPHHGMYASLAPRKATAPGSSGKQEHVLIFKR